MDAAVPVPEGEGVAGQGPHGRLPGAAGGIHTEVGGTLVTGCAATFVHPVKVTGSLRADTRTVYLIKSYLFCRQK